MLSKVRGGREEDEEEETMTVEQLIEQGSAYWARIGKDLSMKRRPPRLEDLISIFGIERFLRMPVKRAVVRLIGKDGSGKTSVKLSLKREMFNCKQTSTQAIEIEMIQQDGRSSHWKTVHEGNVKDLVVAFLHEMICAGDKKFLKASKDSLTEMDKVTLKEQFQSFVRSSKYTPAPRVMIQLCDYGGQEDLFASSASCASVDCVSIMTFNVMEDLQAPAQSFDRQIGKEGLQCRPLQLHRMKRNVDWINHHLSTISVSQQSDATPRASEASAAAASHTRGLGRAFGVRSPPVVFVATHADQMPEGEEENVMQEREKQLNEFLAGKQFSNHVYHRQHLPANRSRLFFCVDNTKSHPPPEQDHENDSEANDRAACDEEDSEVVDLRQLVVSSVEKYGEEYLTPVTWLMLEGEVYEMRQNPSNKIISFERMFAVATEKCSIKSESEFTDALGHLHGLHVVVYFATCSTLKNVVFLDAPWVFTMLSRLNSIYMHKITEGQFREEFHKLQQEGVMSQALCFHLLGGIEDNEYRPTDEECCLMLQAAQHLDIVSEHVRKPGSLIGATAGNHATEYFVPCALQEDDDKVPVRRGAASPIPLVLRPDNVGMFIEVLFFRLMNRCIRHYLEQPCLQRNHAIFYTEKGTAIELFYVHEYVILTVKPSPNLSYKDARKICVKTRQFIVSQVEEVKQQGLAGFQFSVCFQHLTERDEAFVPIRSDRLVSLNRYPKSRHLAFLNKRKVYLTDEEKSSIDMWFDIPPAESRRQDERQSASEVAASAGIGSGEMPTASALPSPHCQLPDAESKQEPRQTSQSYHQSYQLPSVSSATAYAARHTQTCWVQQQGQTPVFTSPSFLSQASSSSQRAAQTELSVTSSGHESVPLSYLAPPNIAETIGGKGLSMPYQSGATSVSAHQQHWPPGIEPSPQATRLLASSGSLCRIMSLPHTLEEDMAQSANISQSGEFCGDDSLHSRSKPPKLAAVQQVMFSPAVAPLPASQVPSSNSRGEKIDVIIVTAATTELDAVKGVLEKAAGMEAIHHPILDRGEPVMPCVAVSWKPTADSPAVRIGVTQQAETGQTGTVDIGVALCRAMQSGAVKETGFAAMVGMCAGDPARVNLGDMLVPWKISTKVGRQRGGGHMDADATYADIQQTVKVAVQSAMPGFQSRGSAYKWMTDYIPDCIQNAPSPQFLLDATLNKLHNADSELCASQVQEFLLKSYSRWPKELITEEVIKESLLNLKRSRYAEMVDEWKQTFKISNSGKEQVTYVKENFHRFPRVDSPTPKIFNDPVVMGDIVNTGMDEEDWKRMRKDVGQRKAVCYEMEGFRFLDHVKKHCESMKRLFIKVVSDNATDEYKMENKYYQVYASSVAAAFFLHILAVNPHLTGGTMSLPHTFEEDIAQSANISQCDEAYGDYSLRLRSKRPKLDAVQQVMSSSVVPPLPASQVPSSSSRAVSSSQTQSPVRSSDQELPSMKALITLPTKEESACSPAVHANDPLTSSVLPQIGLDVAAAIVIPEGLWWRGGTLEMMKIENETNIAVSSFSAVIGPSGGECGSDDISITVPAKAVATPTNFSGYVYLPSDSMPPIVDKRMVVLSPILHLSPSRTHFEKPIQLHFPVDVPTSRSGWLLNLMVIEKVGDGQSDKRYTALQYNTNTGEVTSHLPHVMLHPDKWIIDLDHFCLFYWVGRPLEWAGWLGRQILATGKFVKDLLGFGSSISLSINYIVFGKRLNQFKWTLSVFIFTGSQVYYNELVSLQQRLGFIELVSPHASAITRDGNIHLKVQPRGSWKHSDDEGLPEACIPGKMIIDNKLHTPAYLSVTVTDPTASSRWLECTITASSQTDQPELNRSVRLSVTQPLTDQPISPALLQTASTIINYSISDSSGLVFGNNNTTWVEQRKLSGLEETLSIGMEGHSDVPTADREEKAIQRELTGSPPRARAAADPVDGDLRVRRTCTITPRDIPANKEVLLSICFPFAERLTSPYERCLVQFVNEEGKYETREGLDVNDHTLNVLSPAWPAADRLCVRIVTRDKKHQLGVGFLHVRVGDF